VRDVARGQQSIAGLKNKSLVSDGSLKFSRKHKVHFVLAGMGMTGHRHPRSEAYVQQAIGSSGISARQTHGTEAHIKVISFASRLIFD